MFIDYKQMNSQLQYKNHDVIESKISFETDNFDCKRIFELFVVSPYKPMIGLKNISFITALSINND